MSTATDTPTGQDTSVHEHPTEKTYVGIAALLACITAAEVGTYYLKLGKAMVPILLVMMVVKFSIVAGYFMHLRFDNIMFRRFFVTGIVLATVVYLAAMVAMQMFGRNTVSTVLNPDGVKTPAGQQITPK